MKKIIFLLCIIMATVKLHAQFIKSTSINAKIGLGITAPYYSSDDVVDNGFFAQGEYILKAASWFDIRPYAGVLFTHTGNEDIDGNSTNETATTKAFLIGGKARIMAPIPWVAPFAEIGIGTSIGSFKTQTTYTSIDKSGLLYHIPFTLGLAIGKHHEFEIGVMYYFEPSAEQFAGAAAIGMEIPL
ncbi:hypothetical protein ACG2LH_11320 [Zhouia sp. PK063]|uniref:hypothetical protein n=1 Tax=Zhouia sp. PK063 TaxID=3373602 RepID=UPI0037AF3552